ncbi:PREDICTED: luciferin 4-monooxygenase-like [Nicrophorus vespilloides]|uniref:Luciferin 4-monooxygenase-like n=1 Tax=Nicrophorus vespilloides TaxID=110193 RepID=A0ABM1MMI1_NICVS|nr:PREDICTED: luciferin 4-monooxygenase-like [Nicrophorus vespilloides]
MDFQKYYDAEKKVINMPKKHVPIHPDGLGVYLYENVQNHLDKLAQIDVRTGEKEDYRSYVNRCCYVASEMKSRGVTPEDRICLCSHNQMDTNIAFMGTIYTGAKPASLDPSLSVEDTIHLLKISTPKMVFASEDAEDLMEKAIKESGLDIELFIFTKDASKKNSFAPFVAPRNLDDFQVYKVKSLEETSMILFSSGTTGLPKGICLSHKAIIYHVEDVPFQVTSVLLFSSLYWISSIFATLVMQRFGTCKVICKNFDAVETWMNIEKFDIKTVFLAPCDVINFYNRMPEGHVSTLENLIIGGSHLNPDYLRKLIKALPNTVVSYCYGQSEAFNLIEPTYREDKLGSVGVPNHGLSYKVVNPETEENVGLNQEGELRIKYDYAMTGYYNCDASSAWDAEGYLKTGDIVYFDEDFHMYVVDRIKEMFKYKSWHIVPTKLEMILMKHDDINYATVVGIPHPEDDNHIKAIVQLKDGRTADPEEIKSFAESFLDDRHRIRAGVTIVKDFPVTPTGKVQRRILKDLVMKGRI